MQNSRGVCHHPVRRQGSRELWHIQIGGKGANGQWILIFKRQAECCNHGCSTESKEGKKSKYVCRWTFPSAIHEYSGHLDCTKPLEKWGLFSCDVEENRGIISPALTRQSNHENLKPYQLIRYGSLSVYLKLQVSCLGCSTSWHECSPFPWISQYISQWVSLEEVHWKLNFPSSEIIRFIPLLKKKASACFSEEKSSLTQVKNLHCIILVFLLVALFYVSFQEAPFFYNDHLPSFTIKCVANNEPVQYLLGEEEHDKPSVVIHFILQWCDG